MRGLMISMVIVFFCLSINVVNIIDQEVYNKNNRTMFGINATPQFTVEDLETADVEDMSTPGENIISLGLETIAAAWGMMMKFLNFIINGLIIPSATFGGYLQNMIQGVTLLPDSIATIITWAINMNHAFVIGQFIYKYSMKDGA